MDYTQPTNIVVVDDERTFYHRHNPVGPMPTYTYLRTSAEALGWLARSWTVYWTTPGASIGRIDQLWLDHDLGGEDTIKPVVDFLLTLDYANMTRNSDDEPAWIGEILVHSQNPSGAEGVVNALSNTGFIVERASPLVVGEALRQD